MNSTDLVQLMDGMAARVQRAIERALDPVRSRLSTVESRGAAISMMLAGAKKGDGSFNLSDLFEAHARLESRIRDLESRPQMAYTGTWRQGASYQRGDFCSDHGSLWHAWQTTSERPGESEHWQLVAKRGADGRPGRDARNAA